MKRIGKMENINTIRVVFVGSLTAFGLMLVVSFVLAVLIISGKLDSHLIDVPISAVLGCSLFVGGVVTNKMKQGASLLCSILMLVTVILIQLLGNAVFLGCNYTGVWQKVLSMFAGTTAAYALCLFRKDRKGERYKRYFR